MKIAVFGRSASLQNIAALQSLCNLMEEEHIEVLVHQPFWEAVEKTSHSIICEYGVFDDFSIIKDSIDYLFSIGGDGTILNTVDMVLGTSIPVVGINTGRLGFLANFQVSELKELVRHIKNKEFEHDKRSLIEVSCSHPIFKNGSEHALNEFTIQKQDPSAVVKVQASINGEFLSSYWSDGLIVSTPTGSTGYSLSAGGPIIFPRSNNWVITPIAAHNLNQRPIIVPNTETISLKIDEHRGHSYCTVDSKYWEIKENFEFDIKVSNFTIDILRPAHTSYIDTLRDKLMWGIDNRNK